MSNCYKHINQKERDKLVILRAEGWSFDAIGAKIGRSGSSLSREYKRNQNGGGKYLPSEAHKKAHERKSEAAIGGSKCEPFKDEIHYHLRLGWTPAQIANRLSKKRKGFSICYETIYEYIYNYQLPWAKLLPRKHEPRWNKGMGRKKSKCNHIPNRISILERPKRINNKSEFGHFEGDSIVCSQSVESLNVVVERQTQYVCIRKVANRGPEATKNAMIASLGQFNEQYVKSITLDNGIEFKRHEEVKKALNIETYFCQPYHSWEKGLVEQINGLIRRFLPKKTDLSKVTEKEIRAIEFLLNSRPRKLLNWDTPAEVFARKCKMKLINDALAT